MQRLYDESRWQRAHSIDPSATLDLPRTLSAAVTVTRSAKPQPKMSQWRVSDTESTRIQLISRATGVWVCLHAGATISNFG
jgi:hypothetical protein